MNQEERLSLLEEALARRLPGQGQWQSVDRGQDTTELEEAREYQYEIRSDRSEAQRLVVLLRSDGAVQVEYHAEKPGSPFEALFPVDDGKEAATVEQVAAFVADLLGEQLVLGYAKGFWTGGRQFLRPHEVDPPDGRRIRWVTSWRGTHDWPA
ncbi:MAG TPA: hypothetical protein VMY76_04845 [Gemmatimonadales bacterium]|nr:hypothetical protein [Gemmatimonadales bacterium]